MKRTSLIVTVFVLMSLLFVGLRFLPDARATTLYVGGAGPGNYTAIQAAIDDANPGDSIYVYSGTYVENVRINKTLSLMGENRSTTVVDANGSGNAVFVSADWVNVSGMMLTNGEVGLRLENTQNCRIENNNASNNSGGGIWLFFSHNNTIKDNTASNLTDGMRWGYAILLAYSNNNTASGNLLWSPGAWIELGYSHNNNITENKARGTDTWIRSVVSHTNRISANDGLAIDMYSSNRTTITGNTMSQLGIRVQGNLLGNWNTHAIDATNTLGGRPIYYWANATGGTIPPGAAQVILANCTNVVVENQTLSNTFVGILLGFSPGNLIDHNTVNNSENGIRLESSPGNEISNNTIHGTDYDMYYGILLYRSGNSTVVHNNVSGLYLDGIRLDHSSNSTVAHNEAFDNQVGVIILSSSNCTVVRNTLPNRAAGVFLSSDSNVTVEHNNLSDSPEGLVLSNSNNITVSGNDIRNALAGIHPFRCANVTITGNNISLSTNGIYASLSENVSITSNDMLENDLGIEMSSSTNLSIVGNRLVSGGGGISLMYSENATVEGNNVSENKNGISLLYASNVTIVGNEISNNFTGIYFEDSPWVSITGNNISRNWLGIKSYSTADALIAGNNISDNDYGIVLLESRDFTINNNTLTRDGIVMYGVFREDFNSHTIPANNSVNGKPLYYFKGLTSVNVDGIPVGQLIVASCSNVSATGIQISETDGAVQIFYSSNVVIADSDFSLNSDPGGVRLHRTDGAIITGNAISDNDFGVVLQGSSSVLVHHNEFLFNEVQAYDDWTGMNLWDDGYPSGGNLWSDYEGDDLFSGPNQDQPGSDGIGDDPYSLDIDYEDRYPIFRPRPPEIFQSALSGNRLENVTLEWSLSPDDGAGHDSVVGYRVYRNTTFDSEALGYQLIAFVPNGTSSYIDIGAGEGNPDSYFYLVCGVDRTNLSKCTRNQVGKFTRPLSQGPNLVSIPLIQSNESIETVLQTVKYDKAWYYDSSSREWKWYMTSKTYRRGLWNMDHTTGIWVNVTEDSNLTVAGIVPAQTAIRLHEGWNLVSFPSFNTTYTVADLKSEIGATRVEGYDLAPPNFLRVLGGAEVLLAGYGYWARVEMDTVWTVEID